VLSVLGKAMERCPVCSAKVVTNYEREEVCTQCGLVVSEVVVDMGPEWRAFEMNKRARAAPLKLRWFHTYSQ